MMSLVTPPISAVLDGTCTLWALGLAAVVSLDYVDARYITYHTNTCWWRVAGDAYMHNSFFLRHFSCNMALMFSHPKGVWQVSQMSFR